jgi:peroxidase
VCSNGGSLGALNHAIVVDQFERLRQGDSWWFERSGVLDAATLLEVQSTLFVDVVKRNSNLKNVQDNYFFFKTSVGGKVVALVGSICVEALRLHCHVGTLRVLAVARR